MLLQKNLSRLFIRLYDFFDRNFGHIFLENIDSIQQTKQFNEHSLIL